MTLLLVLTQIAACALGYGACLIVGRLQQQHRERAIRALGGELPDWELRARKLEDEADRHEIENMHMIASDRRTKARLLRRVARRRLRQGLPALP